MPERAPGWAWIALLVPVTAAIIAGIVLAIPNGSSDAKAAPVEKPAVLPEQDAATTVVLPEDGNQSAPIDTNDKELFPVGWCLQFDGPSDDVSVYEDGVAVGRIADLSPRRAVYHFAYTGGGRVDALIRPNC